MNTLYLIELVSHIIFGTIGVVCYFIVWKHLAKPEFPASRVRLLCITGLIAFFVSQLTGGLYYTSYYTSVVKSVIGNSAYPWAHAVFMDTKEHIFLFLPYVSVTITAIVWFLHDEMGSDGKLRTVVSFLTGLVVILGTAIAVSGMVISGAVR